MNKLLFLLFLLPVIGSAQEWFGGGSVFYVKSDPNVISGIADPDTIRMPLFAYNPNGGDRWEYRTDSSKWVQLFNPTYTVYTDTFRRFDFVATDSTCTSYERSNQIFTDSYGNADTTQITGNSVKTCEADYCISSLAGVPAVVTGSTLLRLGLDYEGAALSVPLNDPDFSLTITFDSLTKSGDIYQSGNNYEQAYTCTPFVDGSIIENVSYRTEDLSMLQKVSFAVGGGGACGGLSLLRIYPRLSYINDGSSVTGANICTDSLNIQTIIRAEGGEYKDHSLITTFCRVIAPDGNSYSWNPTAPASGDETRRLSAHKIPITAEGQYIQDGYVEVTVNTAAGGARTVRATFTRTFNIKFCGTCE